MEHSKRAIRVLIVDDHEMFAESLSHLLAQETDVCTIGVAHTIRRGVEMAGDASPDVVLLDYRLPDGDGPEAAFRIKDVCPDARIVMVTAFNEEHLLMNAIDAGCVGFLTKDQAAEEVVKAIHTATEEDLVISPKVVAQLVPRLTQRDRRIGTDLTNRERQVLEILAEGCPTAEIAERLVLSVYTVRNHIQNVITKLGASSKLQAVMIAVREGLVRIPRG